MAIIVPNSKRTDSKNVEIQNRCQKLRLTRCRGGCFVKTEWENGDVYVGGDNALLIKLYYRVSVAGWNNLQLPKFKNCEVSDGEISRNTRYGTAQVNGISYNTVVIIKKIIKPGKGKLSIGSGDLDIVVNVPNKNDFGEDIIR